MVFSICGMGDLNSLSTDLRSKRRGLGARAPPGADEASATREKTRSFESKLRLAHLNDYVFEWEEEMQRISIPFPSPSPPNKNRNSDTNGLRFLFFCGIIKKKVVII